MTTLAERLATLMAEKGLSQAELARIKATVYFQNLKRSNVKP